MSQRQTNSTVQTLNHVCKECNEAVCGIILVFDPLPQKQPQHFCYVSQLTEEVTYMCFYVRHSMQKVVICLPLVAGVAITTRASRA